MHTKALRPITISLLLVLLCAASGLAQQTAPDPTPALENLRAAVSKLRAIDRDPNTPAEIRAFNRDVLLEKEAQLRPLLKSLKQKWRAYLSDNAAELSEEQVRSVGAKAAAIDTELGQMISGEQPEEPRAARADSPVGVPVGEPIGEQPVNPATPPATETQPVVLSNNPQGGQALTTQGGGQTTSSTGTATQPSTVVLDLDRELRKSAGIIQAERARDPSSSAARFFYAQHIQLILAALVAQKATSDTATVAENARTDKQLEGNEAQRGTTSLVSKGGIPAVLGFAVSNGALTRSASGNTVTFQLNPVGLISTLAQRGFISSFQNETGFERQLRNFALGFSFDTSRGDTGGVFTGSGQQLSGLSVRYNIINRRDPRDRSYQDRFIDLAKTRGVPIALNTLQILNNSFNLTDPPPSLDEWERKTREALLAAPGEERRVLEEQIRKLPISDLPPEVDDAVTALSKNIASFRQAREELLERVASGLVVTAEYNLERRGDMPDVSNIRFIVEKGAYDGKIDLTFNSSLSFFHSRPTGANTDRLRDFRFAGQFDVPLGNPETTGKFLLSFAGRYQRLLEDETLPNGGILSARGDIAVGQLKLTIPIRGTAFKIPLSVSFANRTELLQEREVRGNFGFTFDLDSIFARFNPFKP